MSLGFELGGDWAVGSDTFVLSLGLSPGGPPCTLFSFCSCMDAFLATLEGVERGRELLG